MDDGPLRISVCLIWVHHPLAADTLASATITVTTIRKPLKRVITMLVAPRHHIFSYFTASVMLAVKWPALNRAMMVQSVFPEGARSSVG